MSTDGTFANWVMSRDLKKVLTTKQHTTSRNLSLLFRPEVYLAAVNYSLKLEQQSTLVEAIRDHQLSRLIGDQVIDAELIYAAAGHYMYSL
jgi:hypothetical protein